MKNFIIIILSVLLIICLVRISYLSIHPDIVGQYQAIDGLPDYYNFNSRKDKFTLSKNDVIIQEGAVEAIEHNTFLCKSEDAAFVITLNKKGFYLVIEGKAYNFRKVTSVPSGI